MRISQFAQFGWAAMPSLDPLIEAARDAERRGFHGFWIPNVFGIDAMTALAVVGHETQRIELGTAVVPTYPRHPAVMAQQALTLQTASQGRFSLGIGLSHKMVIEGMFGMSFEKPARHMRGYLEVLAPLLRGEAPGEGGEFTWRGQLAFDTPAPSLVIAALGPIMLRIAGELSDGTITWATGIKTLESHIIPAIREAAKAAGRPEPRVVAGLPVVLTADVEAAREKLARRLGMYAQIPSYRAMLDREGVEGAESIALVGDEAQLRADLQHLRDIGVTDLVAVAEEPETLDFLQSQI